MTTYLSYPNLYSLQFNYRFVYNGMRSFFFFVFFFFFFSYIFIQFYNSSNETKQEHYRIKQYITMQQLRHILTLFDVY
jgi:hypothetical protein